MNKQTYCTVEEYRAWLCFDGLRRSWGLREQFPHRGFHGTTKQHVCPCYSCCDTDDEIRVARNNYAFEAPLCNKFKNRWYKQYGFNDGWKEAWADFINPKREDMIKQSLGRAEVLHVFVEALSWNPERWYYMLDMIQDQQDKLSNIHDRMFLLRLVMIVHALMFEKKERVLEKRSLEKQTKRGFPFMLRAYTTPLYKPQRRAWI